MESKTAVDREAFAFVKDLASELNQPETLKLPSFPDIAMRVRKVLEDEDSSADKIARVVGSEPGLATRLLKMANSAAMNRSGTVILDLKTAVNRLGHDQIRLSATSFAMEALMESNKVAELAPLLTEWWNNSVRVASIAFVVGRRSRAVNPGEAMFVGLIHGIGKLYILARVERYPGLFASPETMDSIINDWHIAIGKAILENWKFPSTCWRRSICSSTRTGAQPGIPIWPTSSLSQICSTKSFPVSATNLRTSRPTRPARG